MSAERIAETSILPLQHHVHLLCHVKDQNLIFNREKREHLPRSLWQWGDRRTPKWCVCCRAIGENRSALYAWPRHMPPHPLLCPPEALRSTEQQESATPEESGPPVRQLYSNAAIHLQTTRNINKWTSAVSFTPRSHNIEQKMSWNLKKKWKLNKMPLGFCGRFHSVAAIKYIPRNGHFNNLRHVFLSETTRG